MLSVALLGLGGMGRTHFACYQNNAQARVAAVCSSDERKLRGEWDAQNLNVGAGVAAQVDLLGVDRFRHWRDAIASDVDLIDICLPTPMHAPVAVTALEAGKHVICEKPIALAEEDAARMEDAARANGRQLFVAHCLRFWPQYVAAQQVISSGEHGAPIYARLHRSSALPSWSADNWLLDAAQSGGAPVDMGIHDVDVALWWFGEPQQIHADGLWRGNLPTHADVSWRYPSGLFVHLHAVWDENPIPFRMAFRVQMERATLDYDSRLGDELRLHAQSGSRVLPLLPLDGYQAQLNEFVICAQENRPSSRVSVSSSRLALRYALKHRT